jgi:hypothetical protein
MDKHQQYSVLDLDVTPSAMLEGKPWCSRTKSMNEPFNWKCSNHCNLMATKNRST